MAEQVDESVAAGVAVVLALMVGFLVFVITKGVYSTTIYRLESQYKRDHYEQALKSNGYDRDKTEAWLDAAVQKIKDTKVTQ